MEEGSLKDRIQGLLARCGFNSQGIFIMDGSKRSGHGNAYFTGLGNNKRIVFFDTLVNSLDDEELEAVLAHELGHFKCKHVIKMLVATSIMTLISFAILGWLINQQWFFTGLGVEQPSNAAAYYYSCWFHRYSPCSSNPSALIFNVNSNLKPMTLHLAMPKPKK